MVRVWIVSALVVAAVVAGILIFTGGETPTGGRRKGPPPPSPLMEAEVRTYIAIQPKLLSALYQIAEEVQAQRVERGGSFDQEYFARRSQAVRDAILAEHHVTPESWDRLRRRVEYAVDVLRWGDEAKQRNADLDVRIEQKEGLLELTTGKQRELLEADLEALRRQRAGEGPPLLPRDVELIKSFWSDLAQLAPRRGAPPKKE
ncbi:MAG: hypothetical protein ACYTEZ_12675 [Planctomycetota bacterium]|jgi:hypothetical protein